MKISHTYLWIDAITKFNLLGSNCILQGIFVSSWDLPHLQEIKKV